MARIVNLPPPCHRQTRWQMRYREETPSTPADIYPTKAEALSVKHAVERGERVAYSDLLSPDHASMRVGE